MRNADFIVHLAIADSVNDQYGYEFWASLVSLAQKTRLNRDTVRASMRRLEQCGLLERLDAAPGRTIRYRFLMPDPAEITGPADITHPAESQGDPAEITEGAAESQGGPPVISAPNPKEPNGSQAGTQHLALRLVEVPPPKRDPYHGFDDWYAEYPRKEKRPKARDAWKKHVTDNDVPLEAVLSGLGDWKSHWIRAKTEKQFIPLPASWLGGHQWNDEPPSKPDDVTRIDPMERPRLPDYVPNVVPDATATVPEWFKQRARR